MLSDVIFHAAAFDLIQLLDELCLVEPGGQLVELVILIVVVLLVDLDALAKQVLVLVVLGPIQLVEVSLLRLGELLPQM